MRGTISRQIADLGLNLSSYVRGDEFEELKKAAVIPISVATVLLGGAAGVKLLSEASAARNSFQNEQSVALPCENLTRIDYKEHSDREQTLQAVCVDSQGKTTTYTLNKKRGEPAYWESSKGAKITYTLERTNDGSTQWKPNYSIPAQAGERK